MNDQRVKTDNPNALICEFMGYEKSRDIWEKDEYAYTMKLPSVFNKWVIPSHMLFAKSWDWLMPVVIKCDEICDAKEREFPEDKDLDDATGWRSWSYHRVGLSTDIKQVYKNVLTFIHWYQQQKSS